MRLVDDLLEVPRISRGAVELRQDAIEMASVVRLAQIIGNLLNNAAKYTSPGGHIVAHGPARTPRGW